MKEIIISEKSAFEDEKYSVKEIIRLASQTTNDYVVCGQDAEKLAALLAELKSGSDVEIKKHEYVETVKVLNDILEIIEAALKKDEPDFFNMGYYVVFAGQPLPEKPVAELNAYLRQYTDEHFMNEFRSYAAEALKYSAKKHNVLKAEALELVKENRKVFEVDTLDRQLCVDTAKKLIDAVEKSIDRLEIHKDSIAYTFGVCLKSDLHTYFEGINKNKKAAKVHEKQQCEISAQGSVPES